ncbi:MAG: FtsX-like permease family protein, partial [Gemmatimonadales bacterium]
PQIPVGAITTMQSVMTQSVNDRRYPMLLLGVFAALAVTLAGVGVYGVLAFAVRQRSREIGIRMALGAAPASVTRMIVMSGMRLTAAGLVIGAVAGVAAARLLGTLLFDTSRTDPLTLAGAAGVFAAVALVAVAIPALRAARVDPIITMRAE